MVDKLQDKNIEEYYNLTRKILKKGILTKKESAHLAVMFADAAFQCDKKNKKIDGMFDKLLGM